MRISPVRRIVWGLVRMVCMVRADQWMYQVRAFSRDPQKA